MTDGEQQFLRELDQAIGKHPEKQEIMAEYKLHVFDLLEELPNDEVNTYEKIVHRLGTPEEIAALWKQENSVTPKKMQRLFVLCNIVIFIAGALLTIGYNLFDWSWLESLWAGLTEVTTLIIFAYMLFWGLLGYEIGKEFGHRGYKILRRTFLFSIIPNLILMYLIVFKFIPYEWFQPLLTVPFIVLCIICTAILFPISWVGYRWGRKDSV